MKILITSPDAILDKSTSTFFDGILDAFDFFLNLDPDYHIAVISARKDSLNKIPAKYHPMHVGTGERGGKILTDQMKDTFKCETGDLIVLGCKDRDLYLASHSKLLLLRAGYAMGNNPTEKIYTKPYGRFIGTPAVLTLFFEKFLTIKRPWYYELQITEATTIYALTNANTFYTSTDEKVLNNKFKDCLKMGNPKYRSVFLLYSTVCSYFIANELENVTYFAVFPSSSGDNEDLNFFKNSIRESYGNRNQNELFIRHKQSIKRHDIPGQNRIANGCDNQFETLHINPYFRHKLKGATICVIDDFTSYGTSCETIRHLLERQGVARIVFIALGKFGKEYHVYNYFLKGDVFTPDYEYQRNDGQKLIQGNINSFANKDFVDSLIELTQ